MDSFKVSDLVKPGNLYLVPPYLDGSEKVLDIWKSLDLEDHVFICSSGTSNTGSIKSYCISKDSLFNNAKAVNDFLGAKKEDVWLVSLPHYHIGGLSIFARSSLLGSSPIVTNQKWRVDDFNLSFNFASVVPAQLFDLVQAKMRPNKQLKGLFVGGDFLNSTLCGEAIKLGWPVIKTYGMTELSSQLASSYVKDQSDWLDILPIHKVNENGILSSSLYTSKIIMKDEIFKIELAPDVFIPEDRYELNSEKNQIRVLGRKDGQFNYLGKLFDFNDLLEQVQTLFLELDLFKFASLVLEKDERYGKRPIILLEKTDFSQALEEKLKKDLFLSYFNIKIRVVEKIQRTELGKVRSQ